MAIEFVDTVDLNGNTITGLADPSADSDAATKGYVTTAVAGAGGMDAEGVQDAVGAMVTDSATVDATYNDGAGTLTLAVLDSPTVQGHDAAYMLARGNHTGTQTASTISDFNTAAVAAANAGTIDADTLGGSTKTQVIADAIAGVVDTAPTTLDTLNELAAALGDDANFAATVNAALAARVQTYAQTLTTSATSYTVTHNLGTKDVTVQVYAVSDGAQVWTTIKRTSASVVTLTFASAPAANAYRVVVHGRAD